MSEIEVTRADRAIAERFNCDLRCNMTGTQVHNLAGAFARRRIEATVGLQAEKAELVAMLCWWHSHRFVLQAKFDLHGPQDVATAMKEQIERIDAKLKDQNNGREGRGHE